MAKVGRIGFLSKFWKVTPESCDEEDAIKYHFINQSLTELSKKEAKNLKQEIEKAAIEIRRQEILYYGR